MKLPLQWVLALWCTQMVSCQGLVVTGQGSDRAKEAKEKIAAFELAMAENEKRRKADAVLRRGEGTLGLVDSRPLYGFVSMDFAMQEELSESQLRELHVVKVPYLQMAADLIGQKTTEFALPSIDDANSSNKVIIEQSVLLNALPKSEFKKMKSELNRVLVDVLDPDQYEALIAMKLRTGNEELAFVDPHLGTFFEISDEQLEAFERVRERFVELTGTAIENRNATKNYVGMADEVETLRSEFRKAVRNLLNEDQKLRIDELAKPVPR